MKVTESSLPGVLIVEPKRFSDERGFFSESFSSKLFNDESLEYDFVQDNHSLSLHKGTVRGLHYQAPPHAQAKLVRCGRGALFDVAVDVRMGSPSYGQWFGIELSFENGKQLLIPAGFLHGFVTLEPETEIVYKCTDFYSPECDGAVRWDSCGVDWPELETEPLLSSKDVSAIDFASFSSPFKYEAKK